MKAECESVCAALKRPVELPRPDEFLDCGACCLRGCIMFLEREAGLLVLHTDIERGFPMIKGLRLVEGDQRLVVDVVVQRNDVRIVHFSGPAVEHMRART